MCQPDSSRRFNAQAAEPVAQGMAKFEGIMAAYKLSLRDEHCIYSRVRTVLACLVAALLGAISARCS